MFGFYPFNPSLGQVMQSDVDGVNVDASFVAHFHVDGADAIAADVDAVIAAFNVSGDTAVVKTTGFTNPAVPKNLVAATDGTAGDIKAVQVIVEGTNYLDEVITETLPVFTVDTKTTVVGSKAFKTVTKVTVPAMDGAGATVSIGVGEKLGLPYKLSRNTVIPGMTFLNNAREATEPTVTVSSTAIESNTIDLNTALDGAKDVDVYIAV